MVKLLLVVVLLGGANVTLYGQACGKCCGKASLDDTGHRVCNIDDLCHITRCGANNYNGGCCQSISDTFNDVCTNPEAVEDGLHNCEEL